jgi:hypothetical protein
MKSKTKTPRGRSRRPPAAVRSGSACAESRPGKKVVFVEDDTKKAKVLDDRHVTFDNETTSLSALAKRLLGCAHPVQGTLHFKYKGKVLDALRKAHEAT